MLVSIDWRAVAEEVPAGGMLRLRPDAAARIWPGDGAAARFAATTGVPYSDGLFRILAALAERDPASPPTAFVEDADPAPVDTPHGRLQPLGELYQADVFVHLGDGTIWVSDPDADVEYELVHRDLSSLSYLVYKIAAERPAPEERPTPNDWADVEEIVREDATAWDALPFRDGARFWAAYLDSYPML
ncbi:SUKH-4 family immunity protein [Kitasatospora sp. NPDC001540]|uniref:SUKH-4 family immunity protein n=1 Tax=Kitasatospora sp. NPDC001540 TaxID=3364014 RepID=UPI0036BB447C